MNVEAERLVELNQRIRESEIQTTLVSLFTDPHYCPQAKQVHTCDLARRFAHAVNEERRFSWIGLYRVRSTEVQQRLVVCLEERSGWQEQAGGADPGASPLWRGMSAAVAARAILELRILPPRDPRTRADETASELTRWYGAKAELLRDVSLPGLPNAALLEGLGLRATTVAAVERELAQEIAPPAIRQLTELLEQAVKQAGVFTWIAVVEGEAEGFGHSFEVYLAKRPRAATPQVVVDRFNDVAFALRDRAALLLHVIPASARALSAVQRDIKKRVAEHEVSNLIYEELL